MKRNYAAIAMLVVLLVSYVLNSVDRNVFSLVTKEVQGALNLSLPEVGLTSTLFTLGMGLAALPTGKLLDALSRKTVVILGLLIFSIATFLTAYANALPDLSVYRVISGVGEAMQVTAVIAIGVTYFYKRRALITGLVSFAYGIGAVIGPIITAELLKAHGWRMPFIVFGATGIVFILIVALGVRPWFSEADGRQEHEDKSYQDRRSLKYSGTTIWNPVTMLLGFSSIFTGLTVYGFFGLFPLYLRSGIGFSPEQAATVMGVIGIGGFVAPIGGWIGDRIGYYKVLVVAIPVTGLSAGISFTALGGSVFWHAFFALVYGIAVISLIYANLSAIIIESMSSDKAGIASGLFISTYYIPAAFAGYLVGWLKDISNWTAAGMTVSFGFAALAVILLVIAHTMQESATTRANNSNKQTTLA